MPSRILGLASLVATASVAMAVAGPPLLVPADGSPMRVAGGPGNVAFGDINNDGKPDLIVASAQGRRLTILPGQGNGAFRAAGEAVAVPDAPTELAIGHIDADGNLDIALASHDSYAVRILLGDGRGVFTPAPDSPVFLKKGRQPHTHGLGIADFNADGKADLVTVNSNDDNDVAVGLGNGKGGFVPAPGSPFSVGRAPYPLAIGDLNADGMLDLVVTSTGLGPLTASAVAAPNGLTALIGDGRGGFRRSEIQSRTPRTWFAAIADVNGDRHADLLATHTEDRLLTVLIGDGRGNFREVPGSPFDIGQKTYRISLVDLNGDRTIDVAAAAETGVRVLLGDGRGAFAAAPGSPFSTGRGTWQLAVADVNADRKPDIATSNLESDTVSVFLGR